SDIPAVIPTIDRLIAQLDRKTQEVEIEARVVAATRSFARDIGTQLGVGWANSATAAGGVSSTSGSTGSGVTIGPSKVNVPLFSNFPAVGPTTGSPNRAGC
ncbi:MAG: hypothetical protein DMG94_04995, partial [Acidobacteria bacterium]